MKNSAGLERRRVLEVCREELVEPSAWRSSFLLRSAGVLAEMEKFDRLIEWFRVRHFVTCSWPFSPGFQHPWLQPFRLQPSNCAQLVRLNVFSCWDKLKAIKCIFLHINVAPCCSFCPLLLSGIDFFSFLLMWRFNICWNSEAGGFLNDAVWEINALLFYSQQPVFPCRTHLINKLSLFKRRMCGILLSKI